MLDLLHDLLRQATARGASEADAFLVEEQYASMLVRMGQPETVTHAREQRLALRVLVGKAAASASTSDLSRESLDGLVGEAIGLARLAAGDPLAGLPEAGELATSIPDLDLHDPEGHRLTPEQKIALAKRGEDAAFALDPRIMNSEGAEFLDRQATYFYASSHGFAGSYRTSRFSLAVSPVAVQNGEMQRESWYTIGRMRARLDLPEEVGRIAAERAIRRLGARKVKTVEVPVIFDPLTAASLIRTLAAAASGPALYRGTSFLLGRLGSRIAAPEVTLVDDGTLPGAVGSRPFDGEGLAIRRTILVQQGLLNSYLLDTYSGRKLDLPSTHHAARDGAGVSVATTNLYLAAGSASPADLIASIKQGLYVTELIGFGVNMVTGDYSRGAVGLWIENGQLAHPVEEVTVAGNLLEMFQAIDGVGNDLVLRDRTASPTLRVGRMVVAGD
ncbi:MAG: TldD/PmbA family protein [Candidatus Methylomirabilia bacterium]